MEEILQQFPMLAVQIFKNVDFKTAIKCQKVGPSWKKFIKSDLLLWQHFLQQEENKLTQWFSFNQDWQQMVTAIKQKKQVRAIQRLVKILNWFNLEYNPKAKGGPQKKDDEDEDTFVFVFVHFNSCTFQDKTPLHALSKKGKSDYVKFILSWMKESNLDANPQDRDGVTPLHLAAQNGHLEVVQMLFQKHSIPLDYRNNTPLHYASEAGQANVVEFFCKNFNQSEIEQENGQGQTAFNLAAFRNHVQVYPYFIAAFNIQDEIMDTFVELTFANCTII